MNKLYQIAIKELENLLYSSSITSSFSIENQISWDIIDEKEYKKYREQPSRNSFNKLPINKIKKLEKNHYLNEALLDFIETLKILEKLDSKYKELIKAYSNVSKYNNDYQLIKEKLKDNINNFQTNDMATRNPKLIILAAIDDLFSKKYRRSNLTNMYFYFYNTIFAYISEYYNDLLNQLAEYYLNKLCTGIDNGESVKAYIYKNKKEGKRLSSYLDINQNFTFLSCAFRDKLMSFLVFLEAKSKNIILFVDWMYSYDYSSKTEELKNNLSYFLKEVDNLLFLRSINSELNTYVTTYGLFAQNKKMVRQWCSWEIGHFYNNPLYSDSSCKKYQYDLHEDVYSLFDSGNRNIEENVLLGNFEKVNSIKDLY